MKGLIIVALLVFGSLSFARTVELNQKQVELVFGDISKLSEGEVLEDLVLVQTSKTPNRVVIKVKYKKPAQVCVKKERYTAYPNCRNRDQFSGNCEPYSGKVCVKYNYDTYSDYRYESVEYLKIKVKNKTNQDKNLYVTITNKDMTPSFKIEKGDFSNAKVRSKSLFRTSKSVLLY